MVDAALEHVTEIPHEDGILLANTVKNKEFTINNSRVKNWGL